MSRPWEGGIMRGGVCKHQKKKAYIVQFRHDKRVINKGFFLSKFTDEDSANEAAHEWRREKCIQEGWIQCRHREGKIAGTTEIELTNGGITIVDTEDLPKLEGLRIYGYTAPGKHVRYARTNGYPGVNYIHNVLAPEFSQVDHINRDGLDNRKCNLREGRGAVNSLNRRKREDNTSGKTGVARQTGKGGSGWKASWTEAGKRRSRYFADSRYGGKEESFEAACLFRDQIDERLGITNGREPIQT